jgi:subtilisin family serine protease
MIRRTGKPLSRGAIAPIALERLERRDCPAVVAISGPADISENGAAVTLLATISEAQRTAVQVRYFLAGTASAGQDYRLSIGGAALQSPNGTFTFRPGQTSVPITVTPVNDTLREGAETFQFNLVSARGHTLGLRATSSTIVDDDSYTAAVIGPATVAPGTTSTFTLRLSSPATKNETFFVSTEDRSASAPSDYTRLSSQPLSFRAGERRKTFTLVTAPNGSGERDETFVVTARAQDAGIPPISPFTVTITGSGPAMPPPAGPPLTAATFTQDYGWGVVNTAAAIGKMLGATTAIPEVANLGGVNWGNDLVRSPEAWARGYTGRGIVVAVIDTGVDYTHPSLRNSIWVNPREVPNDGIDNDNNGFVDDVRGWDFYDLDNDPMDEIGVANLQGGHGTHVAGTIAAAASAAGPRGVAFDAKIMPLRMFDEDFGARYLAESIMYAANNGAHVINLSLGGPERPAVTTAITHATRLGCIVIIASGNSSRAEPSFPASLASTISGVISVGAVDGAGAVADFANRAGISPQLKQVSAPGVAVISTVPPSYPGATTSPAGAFAALSGTSMAAPHVAGVVALMLGTVPNPKAPGVRDRIVNALVTTSQQPPPLSPAALAAAAANRGTTGVVAARLVSPTVRPLSAAPAQAAPATTAVARAFVAIDTDQARRPEAGRTVAARPASPGIGTIASPQLLARLVTGRAS